MKPGYSYKTVQDNIAEAINAGDARNVAAMKALSVARAVFFKRHPQGLLPGHLAYQGKRTRDDYHADGSPLRASFRNPVRQLSISATERREIQAGVNRALSGKGEAVRKAARLYADFTGHEDVRITRVKLPRPVPGLPRAVLVVGQLDFIGLDPAPVGEGFQFKGAARPMLCASPDGRRLFIIGGVYDFSGYSKLGKVKYIGYSTVRDGVAEKYIHEFKVSSRPLLTASADGKQLHMRGGAYDFTERGIVDRRAS